MTEILIEDSHIKHLEEIICDSYKQSQVVGSEEEFKKLIKEIFNRWRNTHGISK